MPGRVARSRAAYAARMLLGIDHLVIAVVDPKAVAVPVLLDTVGAVTGLVEELAPEKVRFFEPV